MSVAYFLYGTLLKFILVAIIINFEDVWYTFIIDLKDLGGKCRHNYEATINYPVHKHLHNYVIKLERSSSQMY